MLTRLIQGPAMLPVSLEQVKQYLRIDSDIENDLLTQLIKSATVMVENHTGRALINQIWQIDIDCFDQKRLRQGLAIIPSAEQKIMLPRVPFQEIEGDVVLVQGEKSSKAKNYYITMSGGCVIRQALQENELIRVTYKAGYGDGPEDVPFSLRQAVMMVTAQLYENRLGGHKEHHSLVLNQAVQTILAPYRHYHIS